jgi:putative NIF3 family GTP cyclohydrolase 1 type 2
LINSERVGNLCYQLIKKSITLIVVHTTFDVFSEGTSKILASKLGLEVIDFLIPDKNYKNKGMGVIAASKNPISPNDLLERVYKICNSPIRFTSSNNPTLIDKIAIVGGSGSSFINEAVKSGVQAYITADITYHRFHDVYNKMMLIDPGHYEMEQFVPEGLANLLNENLDTTEIEKIFVSSSLTNPVRYYPDLDIYETKQKNYLLNKNKG